MATTKMDPVIRHLRRVLLRQDGAGWTDGQLLASFIDHKDEAAFEALVRRHGPMVFGICRRLLHNHHDAEDAFQSTFLVLARKASSVRPRERVANWLHGVALRTAMKAKAMSAKRRGREKQVTEMPEPEAIQQGQWRDLQPLLDRELNGLPENYRLPILLCDLQGKTIKDAAKQLGWPQGSLAGRLARGRKLLAKRLASRGVALSAGSLAAVVSTDAAPASLMSTTVKAAVVIGAGQAVARVVPAKVAALMEEVLKTMFLIKLKAVSMVLVVVAALSGGVGLIYKTHAAEQSKTLVATEQVKTEKQRAANKNAEKAKLDKKSDRFPDGRAYDFGEVKHGTSLKHTFRIVNKSNAPLNLISVRVSNGSMTGTVSKRVLQPKEEGKVEVTVDTRRFVGSRTMAMLLEAEQKGTTEWLKFLITANSVKGD